MPPGCHSPFPRPVLCGQSLFSGTLLRSGLPGPLFWSCVLICFISVIKPHAENNPKECKMLKSVLASQGCCNEIHKLGGLNNRRLLPRSLAGGPGRPGSFWGSGRLRPRPRASPGGGQLAANLWWSWACRCVTPISVSCSQGVFPVCVYLSWKFLIFLRTQVISDEGPGWPHFN